MEPPDRWIHTPPRMSATFDELSLAEIRRAASTGIYDIRGAGAKRKLPHFDDLLFLGASMSRYPLEGYREKCGTDVTIGARFAAKPVELKIPITIAGMSFGSLSAQAKEALGRGASAVGTSTTTGDGGMTAEERAHSSILVYQAKARSRAAAACCWGRRFPRASRTCACCRKESTSVRRAGIRTGPDPTTLKSKSRNCGKSPIG